MYWYMIICLWSHTCFPQPAFYNWGGVAETNKTKVYISKESCQASARLIEDQAVVQVICVPVS